MIWLLLTAALAGEPEFHGEIRLVGSTLSDFPVDAQGTTHGQRAWLDHRARIGLSESYDLWSWEAEADLLTGQVAGDVWSLGSVDARHRDVHGAFDRTGFLPRKALVRGVVGNFQVEAGLNTSHWGLGMVANDGDHDPLFGRTDLGDRVLRFRATAMPGKGTPGRGSLALVGAADLVVADDAAALADDQVAVQAIFSALYVRADQARFGIYGVLRHQREVAVDRRTDVAVVDGYVDLPLEVGAWDLRVAGEAAAIVGGTDRATTYTARRAMAVAQVGATGLATLSKDRLRLHLSAGYASGDGDPDDKKNGDFTFDRNFAVGSVLFEHVLGGVEMATHALLSDPELSGQPPDGVDALATEGSFRRAAFAQPAVELLPNDWSTLRLGAAMVLGTAPYSQPYYTYRNGGTPTSHHGLPSESRLLGTELDWALAVHRPGDEGLRPGFEIQGGHALLGAPLRGSGPPAIHHVMGTARLRW